MHNLPRTHNFTSAHLTGSRASLLEREGEIEGKGKWGEELQTGALGWQIHNTYVEKMLNWTGGTLFLHLKVTGNMDILSNTFNLKERQICGG